MIVKQKTTICNHVTKGSRSFHILLAPSVREEEKDYKNAAKDLNPQPSVQCDGALTLTRLTFYALSFCKTIEISI